MALTSCPECGKDNVSDTAAACPVCGYPINEYFTKMESVRKTKEDLERKRFEEEKAKLSEGKRKLEEEERKWISVSMPEKPKLGLVWIVIGIVIAIFGGILLATKGFVQGMIVLILGIVFVGYCYVDYRIKLKEYDAALFKVQAELKRRAKEKKSKLAKLERAFRCPSCNQEVGVVKVCPLCDYKLKW